MQNLTKETLKIFWAHIKKYPWQVGFLMLGMIVVPLLHAYIPLLYRDLVNLLSGDRVEGVFELAVNIIIWILVLNAISGLGFRRLIHIVDTYLTSAVMRDLTNTCYQVLQKHSFGFFSSNFVGSLVTKVKRYERAFERLTIQIIYDLGRTLLVVGTIMVIVFLQYREIGFIMLAGMTVFVVFSLKYALFKLPYDMRQAATDTRTTGRLADSIANNINVKLFSNFLFEKDRFAKSTQDQLTARRKSWNLDTIGDFIQAIIFIILEFTVIYISLKFWFEGRFNVGDVVVIQVYLMKILDSLWNTGKSTRIIYEALADANEMTEILLRPNDVVDAPDAKELEVERGKIEFSESFFTYKKGSAVLDNFNLQIKPGERVALVGPSGGGKSTLIKLLLRLYNLDKGRILIDNQDIAKVTQDSLRQAIAFVPQDPILFHRSLMENIRYARPSATDEEVIEVARFAHVHEFVESFPEKYETLVGERGIKLSGGERQRVAIARALLKNAPILVLDEATSSLDSESEMFIQEALRNLMHGRTTIVVAHRLSTIMQMDRILVIDGGKIIEEGKHAELLKAKEGAYQRLWEIQAGGFSG